MRIFQSRGKGGKTFCDWCDGVSVESIGFIRFLKGDITYLDILNLDLAYKEADIIKFYLLYKDSNIPKLTK